MPRRWVSDTLPERFVEVDAARLLVLLGFFASPADEAVRALPCFPQEHNPSHHFTPEYGLQKLDFLLRYPTYVAYELIELCRLGEVELERHPAVKDTVRAIFAEEEPEFRTDAFRRFWRGAYQRLDDVEAWWHARGLVFTGTVRTSDNKSQKHYFLTDAGLRVGADLVTKIEHARWWADRCRLLHAFFGHLPAARLKELQYSHAPYRDAQLREVIPDLDRDEIREHFAAVFGEPMEVARA